MTEMTDLLFLDKQCQAADFSFFFPPLRSWSAGFCGRASLDFGLVGERRHGRFRCGILLLKFINRLLLLRCALLGDANRDSRAGVRAEGRKQRIFVDVLFWSIMLGPQCRLCFYSLLKSPAAFSVHMGQISDLAERRSEVGRRRSRFPSFFVLKKSDY